MPLTTSKSEPIVSQCRRLSYEDLAFELISLFCAEDIPASELRRVLRSASFEFREASWARLSKVEKGLAILELYHGPTYSFKDYAMCIIGNQIFHTC